jgi:CRISPR-associated protein Csm5
MTEYEISVVSPVHIGSGNEYGLMDFVVLEGRISYINIDKVFDELKNKGTDALILYEAIEQYGRNFNLGLFLKNQGIDVDNVTNYNLRCKEVPQNTRGFIKNAFTIPLIPGSSIKGAIRTAVAWYLLKDRKNEVEDILNRILREIDEIRDRNEKMKKIRWWERRIGHELENLIFYGKEKDPKFDIFKSMIVTDASFESVDQLSIGKCKVLSTTGDNMMMPKPYDIFLEVLEPPVKSKIMEISLNTYFLEKKNQNLGYNTNHITFLKEFPKACNEFSKAIIEYELTFFEHYNLSTLKNYYENLFNMIPNTDDEFLLRVGHGIGWLSTTLGLLLKENEGLLRKLRKTFYLGRRRYEPYFLPEYPKSRKIIFDDNNPTYPMGWIKLKKHEE